LRADEDLRALAEWGDLDAVREKSPEFGTAFDDVLTRIGHRGPNETELAGFSFAERPDLVFSAALAAARKPVPLPEPEQVAAEPEQVAPLPESTPPLPEQVPPVSEQDLLPTEQVLRKLEQAPSALDQPASEAETTTSAPDVAEPAGKPATPTPPRPKRKLVEKFAIAGRRQRELAVDATIRYSGELRRLVREWGRRQVHAGRLVDVEDAFFLTFDELLAPPADALARVERRRADRERLAGVRMPTVVSGSWRPETPDYPTTEGKRFHGVGVSAGVVEGPVRVLTDARVDVEVGEVVVVRTADVGHAALLGPAAAIVTDLGGPLCRAAVVARELGVPCVTGTRDASARLASGAVVRVDGTTGDVTVLTPAPASMRV
jgi:phosphohistidine swiveling domain-containing protein